ncbi:FAD dependent oxidoreductase-domain-containing protein [Hypoxylon cercidicola]|nr:FAD dependent oxidoreductase-domain-containing protein [Hypoxylon cercidicola]
MAPDLNSLPPSSPSSARPRIMTSSNNNGDPSARGESVSPSPRSASTSLQAAATMNAGLQHEPTRRSSSSSLSRQRQSPQAGRRRSAVLMNLQLNDPYVPGPGEMVAEGASSGPSTTSPQPMSISPLLTGGDPHHNRAPSLGELHQELEAEQEAQVNRLLQMIRQQQLQLQQLQAAQGQSQTSVAAEDATPTSERSYSMVLPNPGSQPAFPAPSTSVPRSPVLSHPRSSFDIAREALHRRSRTPSRGAPSPRMRSTSISGESGEPHLSGVRDESAYYQAETQSMVRENQMLRHRIRELERQLNDAHTNLSLTREPAHHSHLTQSTSMSEEEGVTGSSATAASSNTTQPTVIGGGVVGLAIARALAAHRPGGSDSTLLLERHPQVGTETSSRNSEVIHGGLYYDPASLKTRLCVAGRRQLYAFCGAYGVAHARVGKWVVAQDAAQLEALERIHAFSRAYENVPTRWVAEDEARRLEPDVAAKAGVLESPETGIVDSHGLMAALHGLFEDAGGVTALSSSVAAVEPLRSGRAGSLPGSGGWRLTVRDTRTGEASTVTASTLINSAGLGAADVHNMIAPHGRRARLYYAKGNYFSYGASAPRVSRLVYPVAAPGAGGLGTHLTLDLAGRMRFGPDVEWVDSPADLTVNASRLPAAVAEIRKYLPGVDAEALSPDYAGVRPKLRPAGAVAAGGGGGGFVDFYIRKEDGFDGWVNLLGIESPGLTSCLAIGDLVRDMLYGSGKVEGSPAIFEL